MSSPLHSPRAFSAPLDLSAELSPSDDQPLFTMPPTSATSTAAASEPSLSALDRFISEHQTRAHRRTVAFDGSEPKVALPSSIAADEAEEAESDGSLELSDEGSEDLGAVIQGLERSLNIGAADLARIRADLNDADDELNACDLTATELLEMAQRGRATTQALLNRLETAEAVDAMPFTDVENGNAGALATEYTAPPAPAEPDAPTSDAVAGEEVFPEERSLLESFTEGHDAPAAKQGAGESSHATLNAWPEAAEALPSKGGPLAHAAGSEESSSVTQTTEIPALITETSQAPVAAPVAAPSSLQRVLDFFKSLGTQIADFFRWVFSGLFSGRSEV